VGQGASGLPGRTKAEGVGASPRGGAGRSRRGSEAADEADSAFVSGRSHLA